MEKIPGKKRLPRHIQAQFTAAWLLSMLFLPGNPAQAGSLESVSISKLEVLDKQGQPTTSITDGDLIKIRVELLDPATDQLEVDFVLNEVPQPVSHCSIAPGQVSCESPAVMSLGWHWSSSGQPQPERSLQASGVGIDPLGVPLRVSARPVVMVHGFISTWEAWNNYLGPDGFLEGIGVRGFAAGDGQAAGTLNTGSLQYPNKRTNTIAENAQVLGEYIEEVKQQTGAEQVDLLAHSMGGLISRYYIDRVMEDRDVAQLIMLGSPMAGTDCAVLPATLGLYLPATMELRPAYITGIFNQQITRRHGIAFHDLAGIPIQQPHKSPCTSVPTDLAVSLDSVKAIPLQVTEKPVLHIELNTSPQIFDEYVRPLLQLPPGNFPTPDDPPLDTAEPPRLQFSRLISGHLEANTTQEILIQIDPGVVVAGFALHDTTRSLAVTVRGASGNVIELNTENNGLVVIKDPTSLLYLGYGFENPKPGAWQVTLATTPTTPATGADYALSAHFVGGAELNSHLSNLFPMPGENLQLQAGLSLGGQALNLQQARLELRIPTGRTQTVPVRIEGDRAMADWQSTEPGLYGLDISLMGTSPGDLTVERVAFLAYEIQSPAKSSIDFPLLVGILLVCISFFGLAALVGVLWVYTRRRGRIV